ncbi:MAG: hypothetical protein JWR73_175 [Tardiphaga sp.]|jgi:hypothetical protein|nr:hypothetical protein [Tardiphaga sp.]MDB5574518.1 hypothetical protein [Tardiphaga sp.]MDB5624373.1 hypothetical protein [Tardiphaga sp.]MDB5630602.1 hypothetical protein [Tardiphaga sp.]
MARRGRGEFADSRDWDVRASEAMAIAQEMPAGPEREEAIRKAMQLRSAAEMKGYLSSGEMKAQN